MVKKIVFILSCICLFISAKLFFNMGIFVDEYNTSPVAVCGSEFWLSMDFVRLGLLFVVCILSGMSLLDTKKR